MPTPTPAAPDKKPADGAPAYPALAMTAAPRFSMSAST